MQLAVQRPASPAQPIGDHPPCRSAAGSGVECHPEGTIMLICKRTGAVARVTFVLPIDEPAGEVCVVGDFNDWQPGTHPLTRSTYGTRAVTITLPRDQRYTFRYLTDNGHWFDDPDVRRTADAGNLLTT
jgi:1,4-alpha-glucan branching enzyme